MKELELLGWARDSIKAIGMPLWSSESSNQSFTFHKGITNQRETAVAWSRKTGKPLCKAIVWTDNRTKGVVAHFQQRLDEEGIEVQPGIFRKGKDALRNMYAVLLPLSRESA